MKRKLWWGIFLAVGMVGGLVWNGWQETETMLPVHTLQPETVRYTASYTGRVESAESKSVYTDVSCIAGEVLVKAGQRVEKGDVLFTVDGEATRQVAATLGSIEGVGELELPASVEMVAPITGVISTLNVKAGEVIGGDKPCAVISSSETLQVKVSVPEKGLPRLFEGQSVSVSGVAFEKESYTGQVTAIASSARQSALGGETVVDVTVSLNPAEIDESLRLGLTAQAEILLEEAAGTLVVPYSAVMQEDSGQEYVYLLKDGVARRRNIVTGRLSGEGFAVVEGLRVGEQVILAPERVDADGMAVRAG